MSCTNSTEGNTDFNVNQGATFMRLLEFFEDDGTTPIDVSAWSFSGPIRAYFDSPVLTAEFTFTPGPTTNAVFMVLSATVTAGIPVSPSGNAPTRPSTQYIYDVNADQGGGVVQRILQGNLFVSPEVLP